MKTLLRATFVQIIKRPLKETFAFSFSYISTCTLPHSSQWLFLFINLATVLRGFLSNIQQKDEDVPGCYSMYWCILPKAACWWTVVNITFLKALLPCFVVNKLKDPDKHLSGSEMPKVFRKWYKGAFNLLTLCPQVRVEKVIHCNGRPENIFVF